MQKKIKLEKTLNHPIDKVWKAISKAEEISKWFLPIDFKAEVGYNYTIIHMQDGQENTIIKGEVLEVDEPNKLVYTWETQGSDVNTTVVWSLEESEGKTNLVIEHTSHDDESDPAVIKMFMEFSQGWPEVASNLEKYLNK